MMRWILAAAAALACACSPSDVPSPAPRAALDAASIKPVAAASSVREAKAGEIPAEIVFASSVGDVTFHHEAHFKDFGAKCVDCHHQVDAKALKTPHPEYLHASPVNCQGCHADSGAAKADPGAAKAMQYACSRCHPARPGNIADETLSAKVVVHNQCWKCHTVGTGREASAGCLKCHSGGKTA